MKNRLFLIGAIFLVLLIFTACLLPGDDANGRHIEDLGSKDTVAKEVLPGGGMILTFDDGYRTDYEVVFPILKERGLRAVSYITPIFIEKEMKEYMSLEQVKALDSAGWDIEGHSYSHPILTELTESEINKELKRVDNFFKQQDLELPRHHAYPHGNFDDRVEDIVFEYRKTVRKAENNLNQFPLEEGNEKVLDSIDMGSNSLDLLKDYVDKAVENNKVAIFFTHDVQPKPFDYGITIEKFKALVDYALESEIEILTISELMEKQEKLTKLEKSGKE